MKQFIAYITLASFKDETYEYDIEADSLEEAEDEAGEQAALLGLNKRSDIHDIRVKEVEA